MITAPAPSQTQLIWCWLALACSFRVGGMKQGRDWGAFIGWWGVSRKIRVGLTSPASLLVVARLYNILLFYLFIYFSFFFLCFASPRSAVVKWEWSYDRCLIGLFSAFGTWWFFTSASSVVWQSVYPVWINCWSPLNSYAQHSTSVVVHVGLSTSEYTP